MCSCNDALPSCPVEVPLPGRGDRGYAVEGGVGLAAKICSAVVPPPPCIAERLPPPFALVSLRRGRTAQIVLAAHPRPSLANHNAKEIRPGTRMIPKIGWLSDGSGIKEGGEAPKGACQPLPLARRRVLVSFLSRLRGEGREGARPPFGAPPRHSPPATTPMAQPQNRVSRRSQARRVFCPLASSLRLSTLRADRSFCRPTGAPGPPGCGLAIPPAGTAPRSAFQACLPERRPR